jgi:cytidylate kinase
MKSVIILSGPVGAGKTTVAREFVAMSPAPVAYIEGDIFWSFIAKGLLGQQKHNDFKMIMRAMVSSSMAYALAEYEVLLDFSIPPWFLGTAIKVANFKKVPLDYVVIRPSEVVCMTRAAERSEGTIADYSHYHDLYTSFDEADKNIISDDECDAREIAELIRKGIDAKKFRVK